MPLSDRGVIIKVVLVVVLIILFVLEFFILFAGVIQMIIHEDNRGLLYDGIFMAVVAIVVIFLSFYGLLGAVREYYLKLFVFAGILSTVLLVSLMVHLLLLPSTNDKTDDVDIYRVKYNAKKIDTRSAPGDSLLSDAPLKSATNWNKTLLRNYRCRKEYSDSIHAPNLQIHSFTMDMWDKVHQKFRCCGPEGPNSWIESNMSVPISCCHNENDSSDPMSEFCRNSNEGSHIYMKGCILFQHAFYWRDPSGSKHKQSKTGTDITLATLMRILGYALQFASVALAAWLGILILQSRQEDTPADKDERRLHDP